MKRVLTRLSPAMVLAGGILVLIGVYFLVCKAGLPYQDPTPEMTIRYSAYWMAGTITFEWGAALAVLGGAAKLICTHMK